MASLGSSSSSGTEFIVRVPKNTSKKYNIMAFNAGDKVNCSTWTQARMERDMSARKIYGEEETPEGAAGSEFGKKQREEARRKKFGIVTREFKVEDQPWILKVNGKAGKRFKGLKKGGVTENASYYIFTQCPDGAFEAFPVNGWYNFTPVAKHRTLTAEEAEEEWGRRNKVVNHFSIMLQRRLREQTQGDEEEEESEKSAKKKKKGGGRGNDLRIHDMEDDFDVSSDDSDNSMGEDGEAKTKTKSDTGKGKSKKKRNDKEALEDSDDGDYEGLEVDYMSDESSSSDEEPEKGRPSKGEDVPKGIDEASESEEESEEEKHNEEETKEEEEDEEGKKTPAQTEKKKKKDSSGESDSSDDSDIEGETASALFMVKKRTPPKRAGGRGSAGSSRTGSRPGTPSIDPAATSNTLRAAASKLEQGKRQTQGPGTDSPAAKRLKMDPSGQSPGPSGKSTPQPPSGKSTPSSSDVQLTEEAVRRYLIRKPMTTKDLLKKFQTKRTGLSSEQTVNVLAQILKRLNPERKNVNDKMHFYLTE
ncbi:general transcription factor IIF subunit 1 isoform X1 [Syngnathus scovelli]|uniref:general transcription factor IIF subunit 1 isoform X1 n=1 Tax=Syngnathus scovelli TaxID=161590 RepID=UPI00210F5E48|nr:general transcription factor IIF subunit 1 isoform X1 [Syngnathus scovelli]